MGTQNKGDNHEKDCSGSGFTDGHAGRRLFRVLTAAGEGVEVSHVHGMVLHLGTGGAPLLRES
jgi:hypothetical protein